MHKSKQCRPSSARQDCDRDTLLAIRAKALNHPLVADYKPTL